MSDIHFGARKMAFMLPREMFEIVVKHRDTAIVPQSGGRYRRPKRCKPENNPRVRSSGSRARVEQRNLSLIHM